jgi:hypothetical protein
MNTALGDDSGAMPSAGQYSLHTQVPDIQGTQVRDLLHVNTRQVDAMC